MAQEKRGFVLSGVVAVRAVVAGVAIVGVVAAVVANARGGIPLDASTFLANGV